MEGKNDIFPFDFRILLNSELKRRMTQNDRYSLRAYARDLEIDPSDLSKILNGKRKIGSKLIKQFAAKLGFSQDALNVNEQGQGLPNYGQLSLDSFEIISDWSHYAILELIKLQDFENSDAYIAKKLGIDSQQAKQALNRLLRVGLVEENQGKLCDATDGYSTTIHHEYTAPAFKNLQKGILNKAIQAMDDIPFERRDQSSITVASSQEKIKQAKVMIKNFRRRLSQFLESADNKDTVFNLSVSLYPITKEQGE